MNERPLGRQRRRWRWQLEEIYKRVERGHTLMQM
jgi:hypothetical protein